MINVSIAGTGSYLPELIVDNSKLEKIVRNYDRKSGDFNEWVVEVTGVEKRHYARYIMSVPFWFKFKRFLRNIWLVDLKDIPNETVSLFKKQYCLLPPNQTSEEMATKAAKNALEAANISAADIDLIILNTFTPYNTVPSAALELGHLIGNDKTTTYIINNACAGFIYGLGIAYHFMNSGNYNKVLVASSEILSKVIDLDDTKTAILWGDGAGAAVLKKSADRIFYEPYIGGEYSDNIKLNESEENELLHMPGGPLIVRKAVNAMVNAAEKVLGKNNLYIDDIDWLIPHQANYRIIKDVADRLNMPLEKTLITIHNEGNISGASIPRTLDKYVREGKIKRGDMILMTAVGGGYSFGAAVMRY